MGKNKKREKKKNIQQIIREREKIHAFLEENGPFSNNPKVLEDYQLNIDETVTDTVTMRGDKDGLESRLAFHLEQMNLINVTEIRRDRLKMVLDEAKIQGNTFDEQNKRYEEALSVSLKKGYAVLVKRDVDEIFTNTYNPEWIKSWNANMDMQFCMDFFAIITYVTDYYMKDESGILPFIREALKQNEDDSLKNKLNLVKNTFLTKRQVGESELYYKMFPALHLTQSNIAVEWVPTGLPQTRSSFLKQVPFEVYKRSPCGRRVEGKDDRYYIEKAGMLEKYENLSLIHI